MSLPPEASALLAFCHTWRHIAAIHAVVEDHFGSYAQGIVSQMCDKCVLIIEGTDASRRDAEFQSTWQWGLPAAAFQFGIADTQYVSPATANALITRRIGERSHPQLFLTNLEYADILRLPAVPLSGQLWSVMQSRRSYRGFGGATDPISLSELAVCLYSGFAITAFSHTGISGHPALPLSLCPSAGARNPYESFLYIHHVSGLREGFYHYAGIDHTLGWIGAREGILPEHLLAGQYWFNQAAAVIFLVAFAERTMWKYPHPTGYRTVLIEAGHRAQNVVLAATSLGLAATSTCAVSDSICASAFNLRGMTDLVVYAVAIGRHGPATTIADHQGLESNAANPMNTRWLG